MLPDNCDRCGVSMSRSGTKSGIMSWFTEEYICIGANSCSLKEEVIKAELTKSGKDTRDYEGCGYVPSNSLRLIKE